MGEKIRVACPVCGAKAEVPEELNIEERDIRCPKCGRKTGGDRWRGEGGMADNGRRPTEDGHREKAEGSQRVLKAVDDTILKVLATIATCAVLFGMVVVVAGAVGTSIVEPKFWLINLAATIYVVKHIWQVAEKMWRRA